MNESTKTKKALHGSLFALFLCIVLLIGTTFAWFTDSVSTGVNRIQAGNLDVDFQYWNADQGKYVDAKDANLFTEDTLWEPGHTEVVYLKVINKGNLALKYRLNTINTFEYQFAKNSKGETILLSDYLKIGIVDGKNATEGVYTNREEAVAAAADNLVSYKAYTKENTLLPANDGNESADYLAFVVTMPSTVGNEANAVQKDRLPWIRFNLALNATQASSESDSFDNKYDENVSYPIGSSDAGLAGEEIQEQLNDANPYILVGSDAQRPAKFGFHVNSPATINLNGNTLSSEGQSVLNVNSNLTIIGNGTVDASNVRDDETAVYVGQGGNVTIESGTFIGKAGNSCIFNDGGTINIKGGKFQITDNPKWTLNCRDNSGCVITVTGGKFYKFDPSNANTGAGEIVVPSGYHVDHDGDWYTVVKN